MPLTPLHSLDSDSTSSDTRLRSSSLSSSSRASDSIDHAILSRRSQTPKAKRKTVSNRSVPYISPPLPRKIQSENPTTTMANNNQALSSNVDQLSIGMNIDNIPSQQNEFNHEENTFEKSSDDENEVSHADIIYF